MGELKIKTSLKSGKKGFISNFWGNSLKELKFPSDFRALQ